MEGLTCSYMISLERSFIILHNTVFNWVNHLIGTIDELKLRIMYFTILLNLSLFSNVRIFLFVMFIFFSLRFWWCIKFGIFFIWLFLSILTLNCELLINNRVITPHLLLLYCRCTCWWRSISQEEIMNDVKGHSH